MTSCTATMWGLTAAVMLLLACRAQGEILTPPYFNLAEGKEITASATCGVDTPEPELYCKLVGANADQAEHINLIHGQVCDYCDPDDPEKIHPPEHAVDGMETWWQSPPLSRGMKYNEVNLTINLGQEFHVAYVYVRMGNSPRPGLWILEKSKDYGKTWSPWQYFSDSASDCWTYFGVDAHTPISRDDTVICTTEYSKIVPLEGGEIPISILNNRPSAFNYFNSTVLQEWTRATNVRFRFLRTKNLLGHLMSVARQDPTVTRRYFYSIKDISIGGRCMCNGHADTCDVQDPSNPNKLLCKCQHNTCGPQCATCCKGFEQKKWQQSTSANKFVCEPCNCFGHTDECKYDPEVDKNHASLDIYGNYKGGGVCQNCRDNTEGINCNSCKPRFYKPYDKPLNATDVCQPCNCDDFYSTGNCAGGTGKCECKPQFTPPNCDDCSYGYFGFPHCRPCECHLEGTEGYHCEAKEGFCPCKQNYAGHYCNLCAEGYYDFPTCKPCECNSLGALNSVCDVATGNCVCKNTFSGRTCDICENGFFNYPSCTFCHCDARGTEDSVCNKTDGSCLCKKGYGGTRCDQCIDGYFGYPNCRPCDCSTKGSSSVSCDASGKCSCINNFAGRVCDQCSPGFYGYPDCLTCNCDDHGSIGISCDSEGKCQCVEHFDGLKCDKCQEGYYNFPTCEGCNCDPAGVIDTFQGCGSLPAGELCQCKERVEGRICNQCKPLYWNLQPYNYEGCEECHCNIPGVIGGIGVCDSKSGQCICKPGVTDRECSRCVDGTYNLQESNLFGCLDCNCDIGGSINSVCDKQSGQCQCQSRVTGRTCKEPLRAHYFPTLHQFQYEVESGRTPSNNLVRYAFDENVFPGYSWKGYAVFSGLQDEIIQDVYIHKSSLYRMVLRYVNRNSEPILGSIKITPDNPSDSEQLFKVQFKPSENPTYVTVAGSHGNIPSPLVMNTGQWSISISTKKSLFLDYFVLLPLAYYEATILTQDVHVPCEIGYKGLCRHFGYPNLTRFDSVHGDGGLSINGGETEYLTEYFTDRATLQELGEEKRIPLINNRQERINFELRVSRPGLYVLLITYITSSTEEKTANVLVEANTADEGKVTLYPCPYTSVCRQVVTDKYGKVSVLNFQSNFVNLVLIGEPTANVGVISVVAIPYEEWSLDYIQLKSVCVRKNGKCVEGIFPDTADAKKVQFEESNEKSADESRPQGIYDNSTKLYYLNNGKDAVDIRAKVPQPGEYVFVVQYYQPDHPEFELEVLVQNGKFYEAKVPVPHCPSNSGCRSIVRQSDGNTRFQLIENFVITFKGYKENGIWLDYILVIPADQYDEKVLYKIQFDQTKEFIKKCGNNHFHINITDEGFCRDSVFSLTADYNNGVLPCQCDIQGTMRLDCEKFGGQCPCRPNIIGRRCEICKTGFYGFPECKKCTCPSTAICEPETGECICPPRVTGKSCDQCRVGTYGFDRIIGCEECNCSPLGVLNNNLQCNLYDGSCTCKENIVGRQCDRCMAGFAYFPHCDKCECDIRGTTQEVCDQHTAECFCKPKVQGVACDVCKEGTFNIQANNDDGCTKCFCFGKTTRCTSSNLDLYTLADMNEWSAVVVNEKTGNVTVLSTLPQQINRTSISINLSERDTIEKVVYFSAPSIYLGKQLTSYGGFLDYMIYYDIGHLGNAVGGADVILFGADTYLLYSSDEQPPTAYNFRISVQIVEANFMTLTRLTATREQIMVVLEDLRGIYLRATYWHPSTAAVLSYVALDTAAMLNNSDGVYDYPRATSVEKCLCPPNYQGLSCEECAPGYYRVQSGPYGGYCAPCQCNGHADTCDVNTGICYNCKHWTTGDHCEFCVEGYYGNATAGTPFDCSICACPLPVPSNNFATGCEVNEAGDKISCDCKPGYYGAICESCAAGYFGSPQSSGDFCKPCGCSGNIDTNEIGSCDSVTGECLHCLNNTYGEACNICAPGFYGDAIERKDCQNCVCDSCGMSECDNQNGICQCHENVVGEKCDRCADNHFGFNSCRGCEPCDCGLASGSSQCDDTTGQCLCKPGVTGRQCNKCTSGYWNYGPEGCISCGCHSEYSIGVSCNASTGQCTCLQGVVGDKCDTCPERWVFIEGEGCFQCDSCAHDLLDVTDAFNDLLDPVLQEFHTIAEGYYTQQRLKVIDEAIKRLYPLVDKLDPKQFNLEPLRNKVNHLDDEVNKQFQDAEYFAGDTVKQRSSADNILRNMSLQEVDAIREIDLVSSIITDVETLAKTIDYGTKVDSALKEAQDILKEIQVTGFTVLRDKASDKLQDVNILMENIEKYNSPVDVMNSAVANFSSKVKNFTVKIEDLHNIIDELQDNIDVVEELNSQNALAYNSANVDTINRLTVEVEEDLSAGEDLNKNATESFNIAEANIATIKRVFMDAGNQTALNNTVERNDRALASVSTLVREAEDHAQDLDKRSRQLDDILTDTRHTSAVRAVSAYKDISDTIKNAHEIAVEAEHAATNASNLSNGIQGRTTMASNACLELWGRAEDALSKTEGQLKDDLGSSQQEVKRIMNQIKNNNETMDHIQSSLGEISSHSSSLPQQSLRDANTVQANTQAAINRMNDMVNRLPVDLEQAKKLSKGMVDAIHERSQANSQLDNFDKIFPNITNLMSNLEERRRSSETLGNELRDKIAMLKQKINNARQLADRVKTGLTFFRNTTLELKNPENLSLLATSTNISVYFRTNQTNEFLLYLGNIEKTNMPPSKYNDFMALIIEKGFPVLIVNFGSLTEKIVNEIYVSDNVWRQVIVNRFGTNVKLIVREETGDNKAKLHVKEDALNGTHTIFNLDQERSRLFVGGFPNEFQIDEAVTSPSSDGMMEELVIGGTPVSFWNFVDGKNNAKRADDRDKLINIEPNKGLKFDGKGYAILSRNESQIRIDPHKFSLTLDFKTRAKDGLIYLMTDNSKFLSLEMKNGQVLFQFDLGDGPASALSPNTYNDGRLHRLKAARLEQNGNLKIDGDSSVNVNTVGQGTSERFTPTDRVYFGGYPTQHFYRTVTNSGFDGCIDNVAFYDTTVYLSSNIQARGVMSGCPVRRDNVVSFGQSKPGYVKWNNLSARNLLRINLKFKTEANNGLIFYAVDADQKTTSSLSIVKGTLVFKSQNAELRSSTAGRKFDDNEWHVVTAMHNGTVLELVIDDADNFKSEEPVPQFDMINGFLYIGGIPLNDNREMLVSTDSFVGCIGDATANGMIIDFASTMQRSNAFFGNCMAVGDELPDETVTDPTPPTEDIHNRFPEVIEETTIRTTTRTTEAPTTVPIPQRTTPREPDVIGKCKLPQHPASDVAIENEWRFGTERNSRFEYRSQGRYKNDYTFSIDFKTWASEGTIFYGADNINNQDMIALYMKNGKIHYIFNCGSGPAKLTSIRKLNDNNWHTAAFTRKDNHGELIIDDDEAVTGQSLGNTKTLNLSPPFYVGGVVSEKIHNVMTAIGVNSSFSGCLRNFLMNGVSMGDPVEKVGVIPCAANVEPGIFFYPGDGSNFYKAFDKFVVGRMMEIQMEIKPRSPNGHLLSIHGKRDYAVLEMVNDTIKFTVKGFRGSIETTVKPPNDNSLCDGEWHKITAIKQKNVILLSVDQKAADPGMSRTPLGITAKQPLYIGGHPTLNNVRGSTSRAQYVGCISNVYINKRNIPFIPERGYGAVTAGVCPTI